MAMFNENIYSVPAFLKELTRQVVASVVDRDIVYVRVAFLLGPCFSKC